MGVVSIEKCPDYNIDTVTRAIEKSFERLGGVEKYIKPGMKVLIKPNLVMKKKPQDAATTHPSVVQAVSSIVQKAGGKVIIADSPGGLFTPKALNGIYHVCGIEKAAQESGATLNFDFSESEVDNPQGKYLKKVTILKCIADADVIINIPKLKTHGQMVYTGAVKNMFGAVHGVLKAEYHLRMPDYSEFANAIIDIFLSAKPVLNIMDAVIGMEGAGPTAGDPKHIGLILAAENAFELDYTALSVIGKNPLDVPVIREAVDRGLLNGEENIKITGEELNKVLVKDFNIPQIDNLRAVQFFNRGLLKIFVNLMKPRPDFIYEQCVGCLECQKNCPANVIKVDNKKPLVELEKCIRCYCCQELCPAKAIRIKRPFLAELVLKLSRILKKYK
ncbi:MAG TPA: DUF362 domain-containing protein [Clostridiaceae bacterium]|nr:DUF362 domain-containing protein [Clostridiaceae bacterium]